MKSSAAPEVVLFRESRSGDPYEHALQSAGYAPRFIPVLAFERINQDALRTALSAPDRFGGLVVTSERAAQCIVETGIASRWLDRPTYAVGPRTREVLAAAGFRIDHPAAPTGEALADVITATYRAPLPLLFPCGTRRRDELPTLVRGAGIHIQDLMVYETRILDVSASSNGPAPAWVVFFSPSGVESALDLVTGHWREARRVAIGPTTATGMQEMGIRPDAVADTPDAEGVVAAIERSENQSGVGR